MRKVWAAEEVAREEKRKRDRDHKEKMETLRKEHLALQQARKLEATTKMIDRAVEHLTSLKNSEDTRLANQQAEKKAKDDKAAEDKERKRREFMETVYRSRESQIALKKKREEDRLKRDKEFAAQWRVQQKKIEEEE